MSNYKPHYNKFLDKFCNSHVSIGIKYQGGVFRLCGILYRDISGKYRVDAYTFSHNELVYIIHTEGFKRNG